MNASTTSGSKWLPDSLFKMETALANGHGIAGKRLRLVVFRIIPTRRQRVEHIRHGHDFRFYRYFIAPEALRIACSVYLLVMTVGDDRNPSQRFGKSELLKDFHGFAWMGVHFLPFFRRKRAVFLKGRCLGFRFFRYRGAAPRFSELPGRIDRVPSVLR